MVNSSFGIETLVRIDDASINGAKLLFDKQFDFSSVTVEMSHLENGRGVLFSDGRDSIVIAEKRIQGKDYLTIAHASYESYANCGYRVGEFRHDESCGVAGFSCNLIRGVGN